MKNFRMILISFITITFIMTACSVDLSKKILNEYKPKKISKQKEAEYYEILKEQPFEAKAALEGGCKEIMSDPWYFLDENLQDERCNAAFKVINY